LKTSGFVLNDPAKTKPEVLARVRHWTVFFIVGLVLSGATAIPIPTHLEIAVRVLGEDLSAGGAIP